jgi:DNA-binding NarL/FixJ family response regulator
MRRADNGDVPFLLLKERIPYILFPDTQMPCRDGVACIIDIRKNREYDKLPVVMYTLRMSDKIVGECCRNGANLYMTKTNTINALATKLRKYFL